MYDVMRARLPSARAHLDRSTPVHSTATLPVDQMGDDIGAATAEMEQSRTAEEATAGDEASMDE